MKINIKIDVSKISKDKITDKVYKDKDGNEIKQKIYSFDVVEVKEPKFIAEGDTWIMKKTHFCAETQTKEEKDNKVTTNYIGDGFTFESKQERIIDPADGRDFNT